MPNRFTQISTKSGYKQVVAQINRNFQFLDQETNSKTISQGGGSTAMVTGRLPSGRYGEQFYDNQGKARILLGQAPDDGRPGLWITKDGYDVNEELKNGG